MDEFVLSNDGKGYDTSSKSVVRLPRYKADTTPTFILTGEHPREGEDPRQAYARMLTGDIQFARTIVNNIWAELFGAGVVDPPTAFDLVRYQSDGAADRSLGVLTRHAELLDAMAKDFQQHNYDVKYLIRTIVTSSTYQLSHRVPEGSWRVEYADYFARHMVRRLPAEQVWDAISDATGIHDLAPARDVEVHDLRPALAIAQQHAVGVLRIVIARHQRRVGGGDRRQAVVGERTVHAALIEVAATVEPERGLRQRERGARRPSVHELIVRLEEVVALPVVGERVEPAVTVGIS